MGALGSVFQKTYCGSKRVENEKTRAKKLFIPCGLGTGLEARQHTVLITKLTRGFLETPDVMRTSSFGFGCSPRPKSSATLLWTSRTTLKLFLTKIEEM